MDPRIAVAVGDINVALGREGHVRRIIERRSATLHRAIIGTRGAGVRGLTAHAQRQKQPALHGEPAHRVTFIVGEIECVVGPMNMP